MGNTAPGPIPFRKLSTLLKISALLRMSELLRMSIFMALAVLAILIMPAISVRNSFAETFKSAGSASDTCPVNGLVSRTSGRVMRTGNFVNKGSNEVIIELHNPVTGIVKAHRYSSKPDGIKVTLSQRRGKVFTPLATISGDTIDSFLKNSELCLANPELASECREGLIKFQGLSAGAYRIQVTTALAELPLIGRFKPMFDDSTRNFSIGSIGNHSERLKIRVDFSTAGKIFLTGLVFISFMVFFIGMTIIVVQKAAFPGMRAVAAVGLAILALGWASTLPKMPLGYSLPAALVQFTAFLAIWLKRDFSSLPLPFVAKTCAESRQQLLYTNATLAAATVRGRRSRALAHDKWGNGVSLWIQRYDGDIELPAGAEVCLIDYSPETDIFMVQTNEEVTAVDKAI